MWLFKNGQMQGARNTEPRGVYGHTLSGAVCSATPASAGVNSADYGALQGMSVFQ
jgi:hypothetical protein